jgi:glutamine amidotransferase
VHSFVPEPAEDEIALGRGEYGGPFVSFVERGNVFGAQCHPEKSSTDGLALLHNFSRLAA